MTNRVTEVTDEAEQTGKHAIEVRDSATALHAAVGELRHSVIRVVRTSTSEVDRRTHRRDQVDLPCHLNVRGQPVCRARVTDISEGGANVQGGPSLPVGTLGTLQLDSIGLALLSVVLSSEDDMLHLKFELDATTTGKFKTILERLTQNSAAA